MPRQARLDSPGTLHHVIVRGIERKNIVEDNNDRVNMISRLGNLAEETNTNIYAWALMSNHMHILLKEWELWIISIYAPPSYRLCHNV